MQMKILNLIFSLIFLNLSRLKTIYTYETTKMATIQKNLVLIQDRVGHSVRIFSLESTYKDKRKNCEWIIFS